MQEYDIQLLKGEIQHGISQVDDTYSIKSLNCDYVKAKRTLSIKVVANNPNGDTVEISTEMG